METDRLSPEQLRQWATGHGILVSSQPRNAGSMHSSPSPAAATSRADEKQQEEAGPLAAITLGEQRAWAAGVLSGRDRLQGVQPQEGGGTGAFPYNP